MSNPASKDERSLVYRILWNALFAAVLAVGVWAYLYELSLPALGFHWTSAGIVYYVVPGGAAERAGVRVGDTFWLDGVRVEDVTRFNRVIHSLEVGQTIEVEVDRGEEVLALPLTPSRNGLLLEGWVIDYLVGMACWLSGWLILRLLPPGAVSKSYGVFALDMALLFFTLRPSPAHFRAIEYVCFGLAPALFIWFFLTLMEQPTRKRWLWSSIGGGLTLLAGLANAALVFWPVRPDFNWPYVVLSSSLIWGMLVWLTWCGIELRTGSRVIRARLQESAIKVIILTAPWFVTLVFVAITTWRLGMTMVFHLATIGFPLALTLILLEQPYRPWIERIARWLLVQVCLQVAAQVVYWAVVVLGGWWGNLAFSWNALLLFSALTVGFVLVVPWLHNYLTGLFFGAAKAAPSPGRKRRPARDHSA